MARLRPDRIADASQRVLKASQRIENILCGSTQIRAEEQFWVSRASVRIAEITQKRRVELWTFLDCGGIVHVFLWNLWEPLWKHFRKLDTWTHRESIYIYIYIFIYIHLLHFFGIFLKS